MLWPWSYVTSCIQHVDCLLCSGSVPAYFLYTQQGLAFMFGSVRLFICIPNCFLSVFKLSLALWSLRELKIATFWVCREIGFDVFIFVVWENLLATLWVSAKNIFLAQNFSLPICWSVLGLLMRSYFFFPIFWGCYESIFSQYSVWHQIFVWLFLCLHRD